MKHSHQNLCSATLTINPGHGHIILSQTCSKLQNDSTEDREVDNRLEECQFSCTFFTFPSILSPTK